jgi:uncharacterized zinc-type alcohol dehydrogenase-like protein
VLDLSPDKHEDALHLGADAFRATGAPGTFEELSKQFDVVLCTATANVDVDAYLRTLDAGGTLVLITAKAEPVSFAPFSLTREKRSIAGTLIGGIRETQEMLDFCAGHGIRAQVEVIDADQIDAAYSRLAAGDVRYRFVIDGSTLRG